MPTVQGLSTVGVRLTIFHAKHKETPTHTYTYAYIGRINARQ